MSLFYLPVLLSLFTLLEGCSTPKFDPSTPSLHPTSQVLPSTPAKPEPKTESSEKDIERLEGSCKKMNPPGLSLNLFEPCNQVALQLIYQNKKQTIISIIRTNSEGKFEIRIPKQSSWNLSSTSLDTQAQVDFTQGISGTKEVVVILEPTKKNRLKAKH